MIGTLFTVPDCDIEVVDSLTALQSLKLEWQQFLSDGVSGNNFYNDPEHIALRLEMDPELKPCILVLRRGGQIRCIAPCYQHDTRLKVQFSVLTLASLPIRMLKVFGGQFIVASEEDHRSCYRAVFSRLWENRSQFGLVCIEDLVATSPLWEFCRSMDARSRGFRFFLASSQIDIVRQIRMPSTYDLFLAELNPKTRQSLRRKARKLCDDRHAHLQRFTSPEGVPQFLNHVNEVYRNSWQASLYGYCPRNTESQIRNLTGIAQRGWLRSYLLMNEQTPLAYVLGYQYDGIFYYQETGYLQDRADYGPGTVLTHLLLEDLFRNNPPQLLDFLKGDLGYKRRFGNTKHGVANVYLVPCNRWLFVLRFQDVLHSLSRLALRALRALKLDNGVRTLLRLRR